MRKTLLCLSLLSLALSCKTQDEASIPSSTQVVSISAYIPNAATQYARGRMRYYFFKADNNEEFPTSTATTDAQNLNQYKGLDEDAAYSLLKGESKWLLADGTTVLAFTQIADTTPGQEFVFTIPTGKYFVAAIFPLAGNTTPVPQADRTNLWNKYTATYVEFKGTNQVQELSVFMPADFSFVGFSEWLSPEEYFEEH